MKPLIYFLLAVLVVSTVAFIGTPYMVTATMSYLTMVAAIFYFKDRRTHGRLLFGAVVLDLLIVVVLQYQREAIQTVLAMRLSPLQQAHVAASTAATLCYFPVLYLGLRAYQGRLPDSKRRLHRIFGMTAFLLRTAGFILMFSLIGHSSH